MIRCSFCYFVPKPWFLHCWCCMFRIFRSFCNWITDTYFLFQIFMYYCVFSCLFLYFILTIEVESQLQVLEIVMEVLLAIGKTAVTYSSLMSLFICFPSKAIQIYISMFPAIFYYSFNWMYFSMPFYSCPIYHHFQKLQRHLIHLNL